MLAKAPGKKVSVLGLGISGYESALFLQAQGFEVFVSDLSQDAALAKRSEELNQRGMKAESGRHSYSEILSADWILISPGIPPAAKVVVEATQKKIPIVNEIEAASWFCQSQNIIAVTGSSGKTTVTTLLGRVFQKAAGPEKKVRICGNIGTPWIREIPNIGPDDYVVLELSSFQLAYCHTFRPRAGLILNLSPNHQDWHVDMKDYALAKFRIFQSQQAGDFALLRQKDEEIYFSDRSFGGEKIYLDSPEAAGRYPDLNPNEQAVVLTAGLFGISVSLCRDVFRNFEGIEHRLEKVDSLGGISYVNDSKCTTTASLIWALEKFPDQSVVLIAGGHPKSSDFENAAEMIGRKVRHAVLIGEARPLLQKAWQGSCELSEAEDFKSAVTLAHELAESGDTVLLSPACASFDMFKNYIERGALFKQYIREITARSPKITLPAGQAPHLS